MNNTTIYNTTLNTGCYECLNRLTIARITTGKKKVNKNAYTDKQLFSIQRLANKTHKEKEFIIIW